MNNRTGPGDTTHAALARGDAVAGGWRPLAAAAGEPGTDRPSGPGEVLACLWHLSDLHLCDAESPARLEYLDRFSDPDSPYRERLGDIGTYRPQEALTVQVAATMLETIAQWARGPVSGAPIEAALLTGDLTDNAQENELAWYRTLIEGGTVTPRSGDPAQSSWVGSSGAPWDERYWHPDGAPAGAEPDLPTRRFGYPSVPGLVEAARADVVSPGLAVPAVSVHGNHDGLLQGTVAPDASLRALAIGDQRVTGLPVGADPMLTAEAIAMVGPARYVHDSSSPRVPIPPDAERDFVSAARFAALLRGPAAGPAYFVHDLDRVRLVCLDTVNPYGGWQGSLDREQFDWLARVLDESADRYVVVASHHPSPTLVNDYVPAGTSPRVLGPEVVDLLLASRSVVAWIAGHVHVHAAQYRGDEQRGFWEITTSSLIDWPQQVRLLELLRVDDGAGPQIALVSTVVDHASPSGMSAGFWADRPDLSDPALLAGLSRELSANDYRMRERPLRGLTLDSSAAVRNVTWRSPDPLSR